MTSQLWSHIQLWDPQHKKNTGFVETSPEKKHQVNQKAGVPSLCRLAERIGVQPGEEAPGRNHSSIPIPKEDPQEDWRWAFVKDM